MSHSIPFNKPYIQGKEQHYLAEVLSSKQLSANGIFTKKCIHFFKEKYNFEKLFLTQSCTVALEMAGILLQIKQGDEVIIPSYTFVSTANAFVLRGAKIIFADANALNPNIDADKIEPLITSKTKAIVVMHYAGIACEMDKITALAKKYNLFVVEDAAQAIDSYYSGKPLGSIGDVGTFSFHETKNITSGEGGLIVLNDPQFYLKADHVAENGTDRKSFLKREVNRYQWVDVGSSFSPSELTAAFLYGQLQSMDSIQDKRLHLWNIYHSTLKILEDNNDIKRPFIPTYAKHNAHIYYITVSSQHIRDELLKYLNSKHISTAFHFSSLHNSLYFKNKHDGRVLQNADRYTDCLLRLPLFFDLTSEDVVFICNEIISFFKIKQ